MTEKKHSSRLAEVKAPLADDQDLMKALVKDVLQEFLDVEMTEFLGADRNERNLGRAVSVRLLQPRAIDFLSHRTKSFQARGKTLNKTVWPYSRLLFLI